MCSPSPKAVDHRGPGPCSATRHRYGLSGGAQAGGGHHAHRAAGHGSGGGGGRRCHHRPASPSWSGRSPRAGRASSGHPLCCACWPTPAWWTPGVSAWWCSSKGWPDGGRIAAVPIETRVERLAALERDGRVRGGGREQRLRLLHQLPCERRGSGHGAPGAATDPLGDSLLVVGDGSRVKIHVHTDEPGQGACHRYVAGRAERDRDRQHGGADSGPRAGAAGRRPPERASSPMTRG